MEATVVQPPGGPVEKVQASSKTYGVDVFRWSKWVDGDGKLWIVTLLHGFRDKGRGKWGANVELLDVDSETIIDVPRTEFTAWIKSGALKRVDTPILL
ncbi:hypothetical protein GO730_00645 [Spirosoma sp. HMF3257]|uniref:Uncharacterized protein n=1 Tax=Spirosoma telluris TaxID=2183553 RepID=A0A327NL58_9BACT|nr:hypothetical protein [Spirosoma telluris]RAI73308.1 hypothetical protein HMF3257_00630 [Spirosoma telluris]